MKYLKLSLVHKNKVVEIANSFGLKNGDYQVCFYEYDPYLDKRFLDKVKDFAYLIDDEKFRFDIPNGLNNLIELEKSKAEIDAKIIDQKLFGEDTAEKLKSLREERSNKKSTKVELVQELFDYIKLGHPKAYLIGNIAALAQQGYYHDFECTITTPKVQLVSDLRSVDLEELAQKVINGEFDE